MVANVIGQLAGLDESAGPQRKGLTLNCPCPGPGELGWASCLSFYIGGDPWTYAWAQTAVGSVPN